MKSIRPVARGLPRPAAARDSRAVGFPCWVCPLLAVLAVCAHIAGTLAESRAGDGRGEPERLEVGEGEFHEGLCVWQLTKGYAFINRAGAPAFGKRYFACFAFREGIGAVWDYDEGWGYIDHSSRRITDAKFSWGKNPIVSEGLAAVRELGGAGKWGFLSVNGAMSIGFRYDDVRPFSEGRAAVRIGGKWGYIDRKGTAVIAPSFDEAGRFASGLAPADSGGRWGLIDFAGRWAVKPEFDNLREVHEGLSAALRGNKWGAVDGHGVAVIPFRYESIGSFSEGLACAELGGRWGFVASDGKVAIPFQFGSGSDFHEGVARVQVPGDFVTPFGFVSHDGAMRIECRYTYAKDFSEGLALVGDIVSGERYFINLRGEVALRPGRSMDGAR